MRKLASIRRIDAINPIPDADAIDVATIGGWNVVVKKNQFKEGDFVIYFEIDSILPKGYPEFEFLMERSSGTYSTEDGDMLEGHRLRTIKLRGTTSQGLIIPLPLWMEISDCGNFVIVEGIASEAENEVRSIEADFSDLFGIKKYEKPVSVSLAGFARGNFPSFIPKTDQERIQNLKRDLGDWVANALEFEVTEKLDGTSVTIYKNSMLIEEGKDALGVCSRNLDLKETEGNVYWNVAKAFDIHAILLRDGRNLAIQGEIIGQGIQGNQYKLDKHELYVFDIYDIDNRRYFTSSERLAFCGENGLKHTPVHMLSYVIPEHNIPMLLDMAEGTSYLNNSQREGLVFKCHTDPSISFKAISNKWLLKNE